MMEFILLIVFLGGVYVWRKQANKQKRALLLYKHKPSIDIYIANIKLFKEITIKKVSEEIDKGNVNYDINTYVAMYMLEAADCAFEYWEIPKDIHGDIKSVLLMEQLGYSKGEAQGLADASQAKLIDPFSGERLQIGGYNAFKEWLKFPDKDVAILATEKNIESALEQWTIDARLTKQMNYSR